MKKIALILILFIGFSSFAQVSLKGYTLGKKNKGKTPKETTVGGINGNIFIATLNDGRIYNLSFRSITYNYATNEFKNTGVYDYQLDNLVGGIEKKYKVELKYEEYPSDSEYDYVLRAIKEGVEYRIVVMNTKDEELAPEILFFIINLELDKLHQEELESDF